MYESHSFKTARAGAAVLTDLPHPAGRDGITPSKWNIDLLFPSYTKYNALSRPIYRKTPVQTDICLHMWEKCGILDNQFANTDCRERKFF